MSYLLSMVIIMFNIMLAIVLGKYDLVQRDPVLRRDASNLKLDEYFYLLGEHVLARHLTVKNRMIRFVLDKLMYRLRARRRLFCVRDVVARLVRDGGFGVAQVGEVVSERFGLSAWDQVDKYKVDVVVRRVCEAKDRQSLFRIEDERLVGDYVTRGEWDGLVARCGLLERICLKVARSKREGILNQVA
jgi:hypothetical protein